MATPEYNTLIQDYIHYYNKCLQIGPNAIAVHLKPSGILSDEVYYFLNNPKNNEDEKARKLLDAIEAQVNVNPKWLNTFIKALESIGSSHHNSLLKLWIAAAIVLTLVLLIWMLSSILVTRPVYRFAEEIRSKHTYKSRNY